jgi:hypothetical protein
MPHLLLAEGKMDIWEKTESVRNSKVKTRTENAGLETS